MDNIKFKRIMAYLIDIFIISLLTSLLAGVKFINPNRAKMESTYKEYNEYAEKLVNTNTTDVTQMLEDGEYGDLFYKVSYYSMSLSITEIVVMILYFTLFPFFYDGQTIGKRLMKIKLVSKDENKVKFYKLLLRSLIVPVSASLMMYTVGSNILVTLLLFVIKGMKYLYASVAINLLITVFCYADIISMLSNKEQLSLHDKILKTKVITC